MLHYLRIAVTALSLTACVLFVALWVRSYAFEDVIRIPIPGTAGIRINSVPSRVYLWLPSDSGDFWWSQSWDGDVSGAVTLTKRVSERYENSFGFGMRHRNGTTFFHMPHWFLVLVTGTLSILIWLPLSGRYSLRTLLIATTLVAVVLGIVVAVR